MAKVYLSVFKGKDSRNTCWCVLLGCYPTKHEAIVRCREKYEERLKEYEQIARDEDVAIDKGEYLDYFEIVCRSCPQEWEEVVIYVKEVEVGKSYYTRLY